MTATTRFDPAIGAWRSSTPRDAERIAVMQLATAWQLAEDLVARNPFYRHVELPRGRDAAAFEQIPLTRKDDVVADCVAHPPYGTRTTLDRDDIRMTVHTSGTSGRGTEVYALDQQDLDAIVETEAVGFLWAGVGPGTKVLLTIPIGMTAAGLWYQAALRSIGADVLSVGPYATDRKVEILKMFGADMIVGTPSYVHRLAVACRDSGVDPSTTGVRTLMVAGEPYSAEWATEIERQWGATLFEQYGCTERAIAWTCPGGVLEDGTLGVLHFPPEGGYCEVVDPATGRAVEHDQEGELIVTPFGAQGSPLLRYATGDRVRWVAPGACRCTRPLAGIRAGAVMRFDDMMKIKGVNVWPATFDRAVFAVEGVGDYRGRVVTDDSGSEAIVLEVETDADATLSAVVASVRNATGLGARATRVGPGTLARRVPEGFVKIKRWTDERSTR